MTFFFCWLQYKTYNCGPLFQGTQGQSDQGSHNHQHGPNAKRVRLNGPMHQSINPSTVMSVQQQQQNQQVQQQEFHHVTQHQQNIMYGSTVNSQPGNFPQRY